MTIAYLVSMTSGCCMTAVPGGRQLDERLLHRRPEQRLRRLVQDAETGLLETRSVERPHARR
jgi:hypothetical protein